MKRNEAAKYARWSASSGVAAGESDGWGVSGAEMGRSSRAAKGAAAGSDKT